MPESTISSFAGWLLPFERDLVLVSDDLEQGHRARTHLLRVGYDRVRGIYTKGLASWSAEGRAFGTIDAVDAGLVDVRRRRASGGWRLLGVRGIDEVEGARIPNSTHLYVGELPQRYESLPHDGSITVMCGSGVRATIAAAFLKQRGYDVDVFLGSIGAWTTHDGEIV